jgi:hypothetical protein
MVRDRHPPASRRARRPGRAPPARDRSTPSSPPASTPSPPRRRPALQDLSVPRPGRLGRRPGRGQRPQRGPRSRPAWSAGGQEFLYRAGRSSMAGEREYGFRHVLGLRGRLRPDPAAGAGRQAPAGPPPGWSRWPPSARSCWPTTTGGPWSWPGRPASPAGDLVEPGPPGPARRRRPGHRPGRHVTAARYYTEALAIWPPDDPERPDLELRAGEAYAWARAPGRSCSQRQGRAAGPGRPRAGGRGRGPAGPARLRPGPGALLPHGPGAGPGRRPARLPQQGHGPQPGHDAPAGRRPERRRPGGGPARAWPWPGAWATARSRRPPWAPSGRPGSTSGDPGGIGDLERCVALCEANGSSSAIAWHGNSPSASPSWRPAALLRGQAGGVGGGRALRLGQVAALAGAGAGQRALLEWPLGRRRAGGRLGGVRRRGRRPHYMESECRLWRGRIWLARGRSARPGRRPAGGRAGPGHRRPAERRPGAGLRARVLLAAAGRPRPASCWTSCWPPFGGRLLKPELGIDLAVGLVELGRPVRRWTTSCPRAGWTRPGPSPPRPGAGAAKIYAEIGSRPDEAAAPPGRRPPAAAEPPGRGPHPSSSGRSPSSRGRRHRLPRAGQGPTLRPH